MKRWKINCSISFTKLSLVQGKNYRAKSLPMACKTILLAIKLWRVHPLKTKQNLVQGQKYEEPSENRTH